MPSDYVILAVVTTVLVAECAFLCSQAKAYHKRHFGRSKPESVREEEQRL